MSIQTSCPNCQANFKLGEELSGKKVRCQKCKAIFTVTPAEPPAAPPVSDTAAAPPASETPPAPQVSDFPATPSSPPAVPGEVGVFSTPTGSPGLGNLLLQDLLGNAAPSNNPPPIPAAPHIDELEVVAAEPVPPPPPSRPAPPPAAETTPATTAPAVAPANKRPSGWSPGWITIVTILYLSVFLGGIGGISMIVVRRANDISRRIPHHNPGNPAIAIAVKSNDGFVDFFNNNSLTFNDAQMDAVENFNRYKVYEVALTPNQRYFIEMTSSSFQPRLILLDPNGAEIRREDGNNNNNMFNQRSKARISFQPVRQGKHLIVASGRNQFGGHDPFDIRIGNENQK